MVTHRPIAGTLDHHTRASQYPRKTGTLLPFEEWEVPSPRLLPDCHEERGVNVPPMRQAFAEVSELDHSLMQKSKHLKGKVKRSPSAAA